MSDDDTGQGKCTECRGLRKVAQDCLKDCQRAEAEVERLKDVLLNIKHSAKCDNNGQWRVPWKVMDRLNDMEVLGDE